jgi:hypothetical protein
MFKRPAELGQDIDPWRRLPSLDVSNVLNDDRRQQVIALGFVAAGACLKTTRTSRFFARIPPTHWRIEHREGIRNRATSA